MVSFRPRYLEARHLVGVSLGVQAAIRHRLATFRLVADIRSDADLEGNSATVSTKTPITIVADFESSEPNHNVPF